LKKQADSWGEARLGGLRRFAFAITVFNVLGHTVFGFEQSWLQPLLSVAVAYCCELLLEWTDAISEGRKARFFGGGWKRLLDFLLPAHITGLAVAMLLYSGDRMLPIVFASIVAIVSKATFRVAVRGRLRHFLNPSNFGITVTLLVFPWVGIAPPYHFTENLGQTGDWVLPAFICCSGTLINWRYTGRLPMILGWWSGFILQALLRSLLLGIPLLSALNPMTGVAFILFSFYMISDPATTPFARRHQVAFGFAVAAVYGFLLCAHVTFGLFFALTSVSGVRGVAHYLVNLARSMARVRVPSFALPIRPVEEPLALRRRNSAL
jgi:enediyne biosynthesis protein E5